MPDAPPTGSVLCRTCGLCCTGVLHATVHVEPIDVPRVSALGLTVTRGPGGTFAFSQPCALYRDERCTAYPHHPPTCQTYRCGVLRKYEAGALTFEEASALIGMAKELLAGDARSALHAKLADANVSPDVVLRAVSLDVLFQKHFHVKEITANVSPANSV